MNRFLLLASALVFASFAEFAHAACPSGTQSLGVVDGKERCSLRGKYLSADVTLTSENEYVLDGGVFFGGNNKENSTLRIQAGTVIRGLPGAFLNIHRGSKIFAEGTASQPIVFTSIKTANRNRGEWGGLVLNGNAPINACKPGVAVCEAVSEGIKVEPVYFGGNDPEDNSGVLRYVRVEFAGYPISQDNELNGITFNAVGRGTTIEYIQVHMNSDDGIEFFGGTAQAKHVVLTANEDDSLDLVGDRAELDRPARVLSRAPLEYPAEAKARGVQGHVVLRVSVGDTGAIESVQVAESTPPGFFDEAALRAVRQWRFEPAVIKGRLAMSWITQKITFEMD